jgi:prophage tail gpP-like protein
MHRILLLAMALVVLGSAQAKEVFVTKDAQGRLVYTDRPESLPAQKVNVATQKTDTVEAQRRYDEQSKASATASQAQADTSRKAAETRAAREMTAADQAKRCEEARSRYTIVMNSQRLYEQGPNEGERRYLDSAEIDATRENAKKVMDEFCAGQ